VSGTVLCAHEKAIATVTLSNPGKLNAIDFAMWQQLARTFSDLSADDRVRCVVLRGDGGQAFAAGGDIGEFLTRRDTLDHALIYHGQAGAALQAVFDCRHPTIALIQGACIGGGLEIAAQCDLRICGESSRFGVPINRLGFSMYPAEMEGLLRLAGPATVLKSCSKVESSVRPRPWPKVWSPESSLMPKSSTKPTPAPAASAPARRWSPAGTSSGCAACSTTFRSASRNCVPRSLFSRPKITAKACRLFSTNGSRTSAAADRLHQAKRAHSIFPASTISTPAKRRFKVATGRRCASLAPSGAVSMLDGTSQMNAGRKT
jgi:hypothetical protein